MSAPFYAVGFNLPGYLPNDPPAIVGSIEEARAILVSELEFSSDNDDDAEESNFTDPAEKETAREIGAEWQEAIEAARAATGPCTIDGPDGLAYWIDVAEPKATFTAGGGVVSDGVASATLAYAGKDAPDVAADLQSIAGSMLEVDPDGRDFAYCIIDAARLDEAEAELRASGYALLREA